MRIEKLKKEVDNPAQSIKIECEYDLQGRRRLKRATENNILTLHEYYLYDGFLQIAALDILNNQQPKHGILWDYTQGKATKPLALLKGNKTYACCCDFYKNVTELIDLNFVPSTDPNEFARCYKVHYAEMIHYSAMGQFVLPAKQTANPSSIMKCNTKYNDKNLSTKEQAKTHPLTKVVEGI